MTAPRRGFVTIDGNVVTEQDWNAAWCVLVTAMADSDPFAADAAVVAYELASGPFGRLMAGAA